MYLVLSRKSLLQEKKSQLTGRKTKQEVEDPGVRVRGGREWRKRERREGEKAEEKARLPKHATEPNSLGEHAGRPFMNDTFVPEA